MFCVLVRVWRVCETRVRMLCATHRWRWLVEISDVLSSSFVILFVSPFCSLWLFTFMSWEFGT